MSQAAAVSATAKQKHAEREAAFAAQYERLNDAQRQAVDTIDGPVMVVAGPGTGKTQVVALRVANILRKTQMRPGNILCLTFSKSGATAMRERLRNIIGSDAYGVTVNTIHGFCNDIIASHPTVFEEWSALEQISDVERYRVVNRIIDELLPDTALVNPKSPYTRTKDILFRISQLKREGVTDRDVLLSIADEYDKQMASKSREGTKAHARNVLQARKFREFLHIFFRYQEELQKSGRYDYDDMILNVIGALQTEDWLLAQLQERYQYILVDEFQDTNGAQYRVIELLTTDPTGDNQPNLFVVGDDDQAIYRFQGANLSNILSFHDRFPEAPIVALTTSYRCTQPILDAAESLITNNTERLVGRIENLDKHLVAATQEPGSSPKLLQAASDMAEPWLTADLIAERVESGVSPEDIAVLVQTNAELLIVYDVLQARNIPVQLSGKLDLLTHPLVEQTIGVLKAIQSPSDNAKLSAALSIDGFACHPADLSRLYQAARSERRSLLEILLQLDDANQPLDIGLHDKEGVIAARDVLLNLHHKLGVRTVIETLEHVYRETKLLQPLQEGKMDVVDFAAAQEFFDRLKARAYEQPDFSFQAFLNDLEFYGNPDYGDLRLTYDLPHLTEAGVHLMTAHRSKGLEFHTVIITNFREGQWDKRRHPPSVSIPEDLLFNWERDQKKFEQNQDERRVAFVAMTRAKRELLFTCPAALTSGDSMKDVAPSGFFAESGELPEVHQEVRNPEQMSTLLHVPTREFDEEFSAYLKQRIEHFSLSATALNHFLEDPQLFLEVDLLQTPQAKEPHFAYGNAVHHVLAKWADSVVVGKVLTKEEFMQVFRTHLRSRELLTAGELTRLEHLGETTLPTYYDTKLQAPYPIVHKVEFDVRAHLGDIPLTGKIDRIDLHEPQSAKATIIDFKTGKPKTDKQVQDYGYLRQLQFYALLIEHGYGMIEPQEFVLDFVGEGPEQPLDRRYTVSQAEKQELSELITAVWAKVLALDFTPL